MISIAVWRLWATISAGSENFSTAVDAYNKAVSSLESRVFVTARRFRDLEAAPLDQELETLQPLDLAPREPRLLELPPEEIGHG